MGSRSSKSSGTQVTNQAQTNQSSYGSTPFAMEALPGFQADFSQSMDALPDAMPVTDYVAGFDQATNDGLDMGETWARNNAGAMQQGGADTMKFWGDVVRGDYVDADNPYLQDYVSAMGDEASKQFSRTASNFKNASIDAGAYGDTNYNRGATWMAKEEDANTKAQLSELYYNNYMTEMARRERAPEGMSAGFNLGLQPTQALDAIGTRRQAGEQLDIDNRLASVSAKPDLWNSYFGTLANPSFGTTSAGTMNGTTTTNQTTKESGGWQDIVGAAASLAGAAMGGPAGLALSAGSKLAKSGSGMAGVQPLDFSSMVNWSNPQGLNYRG